MTLYQIKIIRNDLHKREKFLFWNASSMEVDVTGDQEKRTSPNRKMRKQQRGGNDVVCKGRGQRVWEAANTRGHFIATAVPI
jgi:hypothetical protein